MERLTAKQIIGAKEGVDNRELRKIMFNMWVDACGNVYKKGVPPKKRVSFGAFIRASKVACEQLAY